MNSITYPASNDLLDLQQLVDQINRTLYSLQKKETPVVQEISGNLRILFDKTIDVGMGPQTVVPIGGLNGNVGSIYGFAFELYNPTAGTTWYKLFYNDDTTDSNYEAIFHYGGPITGSTVSNLAYLMDDGTPVNGFFKIHGVIIFCTDNQVTTLFQGVRNDNYNFNNSHRYLSTITKLEKMFVYAKANAIGPGSRFRVWEIL